MTAAGMALADAARALIGCPFRLHGRETTSGLDCVGLVVAALTACGRRPVSPQGYGLRNVGIEDWLPLAAQSGLEPATGVIEAGDVLLIALGFAQHHLVIASDPVSIIHAHAGLRRVVLQPRDPSWQVRAMWRIAPFPEG